MKKFEYTCSTGVIWTSFDHGVIEANNLEEARTKARQEILDNLDLVNAILEKNPKSKGMTINMDFRDLEVTEIEPINYSEFTEVKTDYEDDNGVTHIDGYKSHDPNAEGIGIGYIINGEVYWRDPEYQFDEYVMSVVNDHIKEFPRAVTG